MTSPRQLFTSESVTEGHPDKVCDRISDSILDALLAKDPHSRVAVETMATTGLIHVAGEVTTDSYVEIPELVRKTICEIGYTSSVVGFDGESCGVTLSIGQQSRDISAGVTTSLEARQAVGGDVDRFDAQGAGDQGLMFGYASNETKALMPAPIELAHRLAERLAAVRKEGIVPVVGRRVRQQRREVVGKDVRLRVVRVDLATDARVARAQVAARVMAGTGRVVDVFLLALPGAPGAMGRDQNPAVLQRVVAAMRVFGGIEHDVGCARNGRREAWKCLRRCHVVHGLASHFRTH